MHDSVTDPMERIGWTATVSLALCGTLISVGIYGIAPALPRIAQAFAGIPNAALLVQIAGGVTAPAFALASPFAGRIVSRYGVRRVYIISVWLIVAALLAAGLTTQLWQLVALRVITGIGIAGGITAAKSAIARTPASRRHFLFSSVSLTAGIAGVLGAILVGILTAYSWRLAFLTSLLMAPAALLALALPREGGSRPQHATRHTFGILAGLPVSYLYTVAVSGWVMALIGLHTPFYLKSLGIADPARIGSIMGLITGCAVIGSLLYGLTQRLLGTQVTLIAGMAITALGGLATLVAPSFTLEIAAVCLLAFGNGVFSGGAYAYPVELAPREVPAGEVAGIVSLALYGPQVLLPFAASAVSAALSPAAAYPGVAVLVMLAVIALALPRRA